MHTLVISLKRDLEKRQAFINNNSKHLLSYEVVDAVDGREDNPRRPEPAGAKDK